MDKIAEELNAISKTLTEIKNLMNKPRSKFSVSLETIVLIVTALGILHLADVIRRWIMGG